MITFRVGGSRRAFRPGSLLRRVVILRRVVGRVKPAVAGGIPQPSGCGYGAVDARRRPSCTPSPEDADDSEHDHPYPPLRLASRVLSLDDADDPFLAYELLGAETKQALLGLLPPTGRLPDGASSTSAAARVAPCATS
jgi:hypothetical protein